MIDSAFSRTGTVFATPRLLLRPWEEADAPAMFQAFSDPEVMQYWNTPRAASVAEFTQAIRRSRAASPDAHAAWIAILKHEGRAAGFVNYHCRDVTARCLHVGYLLARPFWGAGLAAEAVSALLSHCFGPLGTLQAVARVHPENTASLRLLARLGFRPLPGGEEKAGDGLTAFTLNALDWNRAKPTGFS